jgi:hypothetical protein
MVREDPHNSTQVDGWEKVVKVKIYYKTSTTMRVRICHDAARRHETMNARLWHEVLFECVVDPPLEPIKTARGAGNRPSSAAAFLNVKCTVSRTILPAIKNITETLI